MIKRYRDMSFLVLLLAVGCPKPPPPEPTPAPPPPATHLGEAGDHKVTESDFRHRWEQRRRVDNPQARQLLLDEMLERAILAQRAREAGLADDPIVRESIESILISRYKELNLQPRIAEIAISDDDLQAHYEALRETRFATPPRIRVAVLWFNTRGVAELQERYAPRLTAAIAQAAEIPLEQGFGQISVQNSERQSSRYRGGVEEWLQVDATYDPFRAALVEIGKGLEPGAFSAVVHRDEGSFVLRLLARQEASHRSFEQVRETLHRELRNARRQQVEAAFAAEQRDAMDIRRFDDRLQALEGLPSATNDASSSGPPSLPRP